MRRTMEAVSMPFHGEPVTDIQVMGVLETRLLDFDKLLLLNVEEGIIPQRQQDSSFIPYYLRKTYHMQTSDERATVYAYNFFRLLSRTEHATLLYASADTAEGGKGQSRFLLQMRYSSQFKVLQQYLFEPAVLNHTEESLENNQSMQTILHTDEAGWLCRENGNKYRLSPSALNTYISCPYSFYLQYILGLRPPEQEDTLFEANTMGSFVHLMMEYIYRTYLHCSETAVTRITPEAVEAVRTDEAKMQEALMAAYEAMETKYIPEHHTAENITIKGYVSNILERDREDAKTGLQIVLMEQERMFALSIPQVGKLMTGGKIDRLDIYGPEGAERLRVVDYKSGSYTDTTHAKKMSALWENLMSDPDKSYVRQTLIYSRAVKEHDKTGLPIEPNLFFCRRKLPGVVTTIDIENETVHDFAAIQDTFTAQLADKIKELLTASSFPKCEQGQCPSYCPFFDLCGRQPADY